MRYLFIRYNYNIKTLLYKLAAYISHEVTANIEL